MSERTHSPEGTPQGQTGGEFTPTPPTAAKKRLSSKQKWVFLAGGTLAVAVAAAGVFQFLRQDTLTAAAGNGQASQASATATTRRPLARVGKHTIPWEVVAEECMLRYGDEVLENIINRTIIFQACQDKNIVVKKEEVDQEIARIAKKFNLTPDNWYAMLQTERNLTPMQYQRDVIWPMLALKKLAGRQVDVTDAELAKAFESAYGERVKAKMIMLDNFRHATDVWNQVRKNPVAFEDAAKEHSIDPNSKALGGIIPPIRKHGGNLELEKQAFALKPGEISAVIQVGLKRWVILKSEGRTEPLVKAITPEIRRELHAALLEENTQKVVSEVFGELKKTARVDNYIRGTSNVGGIEQTAHQTPGTSRATAYPQSANRVAPGQQAVRN